MRVPLVRLEKMLPAPCTQATTLIFLGAVFSFIARQEKDVKQQTEQQTKQQKTGQRKRGRWRSDWC